MGLEAEIKQNIPAFHNHKPGFLRAPCLKTEIKQYAILAAAHLVASLSEKDARCLNSVILFGSVARETATKESDVDLFFDVNASLSAQRAFRAKLNRTAEWFYTSNTGLAYKLKGISNEIKITVGRLNEWTDLSQSMAVDGIVLYGRYTSKPSKLKAHTIVSWERLGKAKGALLNKLYGYKAGNKRYPGLLMKKGGTKLGRGTIMVPATSKDVFISALKKYSINYSQYEVWG